MRAWRLAHSLVIHRDEVNARWPARSKASDGTIGNAEHASRPSDHNVNAAGVVRAIDITAKGIDAAWYAEHLRALGAAGHPALRNGGVVIYNRRIASSSRGWTWRTYTGVNPHISHVHLSVSKDAANYESTATWGIRPGTDKKDDDLMPALTHTEQRELLTRLRNTEEKASNAALLAASVDQRCARLEASVHGVDDATRATSLWWNLKYLCNETINSPKGAMLDRVLRKFGAE